MRPEIERAVAERARQQLGLITVRQLRELGVSRHQVPHLVTSGRAERLGHSVLRMAGVPSTVEQVVMAACLDTGGVASHRTAAHLHGLHGFDTPPSAIEVTVLKHRPHGSHPLATIHSTTALPPDDLVNVGPVPCLGVARTFLSLAALAPDVPPDVIRTAIGVAARKGQVSDRWLWWRLEQLRCRGRDGVLTMEQILRRRQDLGPTESWLEHTFLEVLEAAGLPRPTVQRRVARRGSFAARVDTFYEDIGLVMEVDGHDGHSTDVDRRRDATRRRRLIATGLAVIDFTYDDIVRDPEGVVADVLAARSARSAA